MAVIKGSFDWLPSFRRQNGYNNAEFFSPYSFINSLGYPVDNNNICHWETKLSVNWRSLSPLYVDLCLHNDCLPYLSTQIAILLKTSFTHLFKHLLPYNSHTYKGGNLGFTVLLNDTSTCRQGLKYQSVINIGNTCN